MAVSHFGIQFVTVLITVLYFTFSFVFTNHCVSQGHASDKLKTPLTRYCSVGASV